MLNHTWLPVFTALILASERVTTVRFSECEDLHNLRLKIDLGSLVIEF